MIDTFASLFSYPFFIRALIIGTCVSLCAALLGVSLVLKRYSMIGDGLSHVGFAASAIALALGVAPLSVAVPIVVLAAFLLLQLSQKGYMKGDAAIAVVSSGALAVGYTVIRFSKGANVDVGNYMFGSIYTVDDRDMLLTLVLSFGVLALYVLFYNKLFSVTFDESFAAATGVKTGRYNTLLACLTAVTVVVGMRMMGALLISGLIIFPALTASRVCKSYKAVILTACAVSLSCFLVGLIISVFMQLSPGSTIIIVHLIVFFVFTVIGKLKNNKKIKKTLAN